MSLQDEYQGLLDLLKNGSLPEAESYAVALLARYPTLGLGWKTLSIVYLQLRKLDQALFACQKAVEFLPDDAAALTNLARAHYNVAIGLQSAGRPQEAILAYRRCLEVEPGYVAAYGNLGCCLQLVGREDEALAVYDRCLALAPEYEPAHNNRGVALQHLGRLDEAIASFSRCLQLNPQSVDAFANLGFALHTSERLDEAVDSYLRCLELRPEYLEIQLNLGAALKDAGRVEEAVDAYRRCLELKPDFAEAHSNLLFCLNYHPEMERESFLREHRRWDEIHGRGRARGEYGTSPDPERRLRIGLVSSDFKRHPVGFFLLPVLSGIDRGNFDICCYSGAGQGDSHTELLKGQASLWRETAGLSDAELSELVERDRIDLLIDLAGHTAGNRLPVFAGRPAPVQLSWIGYFATTGMRAMDYVIMDRHTVPEESKGDFVEEVLYLPGSRFCFAPIDGAPETAPLPALTGGKVTFGSFNNLAKVNSAVIGLWAAVLQRVPESRLILKWKSLVQQRKREEIYAAFAARGIGRERLELREASSHLEMLRQYRDVDIALDPYPFSGGMTSCEALWMGVPVLTLAGGHAVSRQTYAFLKNLDLDECIAYDTETYLAKAVELAGDLSRLAQLREGLRERMRLSPLCDGEGAARNLEVILRGVWKKWCDSRGNKDAAGIGSLPQRTMESYEFGKVTDPGAGAAA